MTAAIVIVLLMASAMLMASVSVPVQAIDSWGLPYPSNAATLQPSSGAIPSGQTASVTVTPLPFINVGPNPVGVGQTLLVTVFMTPPLNTERYFEDYLVKIQKPDGTIVTMGPFDAYIADTSGWFNYVPDAVGTWKFQFVMQGMYFPAGRYLQYQDITGRTRSYIVTNTSGTLRDSAYYNPVSTDWKEITVQQDYVASWPASPLPTDYWTRPVIPTHREWAQILGDYPFVGPGGGAGFPADTNLYGGYFEFQPYAQAPNTAHIVWNRAGDLRGIEGADYQVMPIRSWGSNWQLGDSQGAIESVPDTIFDGRCYQHVNKPMLTLVNGTYKMLASDVWQCYDIRTGKIYWELSGDIAPPANSYPGYNTFIEYGGGSASLVWIANSRLIKYEPMTGAITGNYSIAPFTTGRYYMNGYALTVQDLGANVTTGRYRLVNWTTTGTSATLASRIRNNITWPFSSLSTNTDFEAGISVVESTDNTPNGTGVKDRIRVTSASLTTGAVLMNITQDGYDYSGAQCADHGKYATLMQNIPSGERAAHWICWDAITGQEEWRSEPMIYPFGAAGFGAYYTQSAYGLLYWACYDGIYAVNWTNGDFAWHFVSDKSVPFESPYDPYYSFVHTRSGGFAVDGKIYASNAEHGPTEPLNRGWKLYCIDAITGKGIWNMSGAISPGGAADGYLTTQSRYSGEQLFFGKGKTSTTVTAPMTAVPLGSSVLIQGTVLDQSPAQPDTPCVSADSMSTQMEYLHMQGYIDGLWHNITMTGVPVTVIAIDSSGQSSIVGSTTTNAYLGTYALNWTAPKEDKWTINAIFAGDDSYGSSQAGTGLLVGPAPAPIEFPPTTEPVDNTSLLYATLAAVIVAIAIGLVALFRKR